MMFGRVLITNNGPVVRFWGITGYRKATLNRSKMTHLGHRITFSVATQNTASIGTMW
jgi:hypothetical protein